MNSSDKTFSSILKMGSIHKEVIHDESIQKIVSRSTVDTAKVEELLTPPAEVQVVNPTQPAEGVHLDQSIRYMNLTTGQIVDHTIGSEQQVGA